jgi:hypothetical protein
MKFASFLFSLFLLASFIHAQSFEWVFTAGGAKSDKTRCINLDREGNVLLTGEITGDARFGDTTLKSAGGMDFFIAKVSPAGKFLWAHNLGGNLIDRGYGVTADAAGNVYVTGHYQSTDLVVDNKVLPNAGEYDVFVAKYSRDGKRLWIRTAGGKGYDYGHGIAVDCQGAVIVTGAVVGDAKFEDQTLTGSRSIFCAKYDADGKLIWLRGSEGKASCAGHGVALDGANNIYLGGLTSGVGSFGKHELNTPKGTDALIAKLSPSGEVLWVNLTHGSPSALVHEITADANGRVWVAGMFKGTMKIGNEAPTTTSDKDSDGYVAHYDTDGHLQWSRCIQGQGTDYMLGIAADSAGGIFVTGEFSDNATLMGTTLHTHSGTSIFVASFDQTGKMRWLQQAGGAKGSNAYTMAFDGKGTLVIGGACVGPARFGNVTTDVTEGADLYGAKISVP